MELNSTTSQGEKASPATYKPVNYQIPDESSPKKRNCWEASIAVGWERDMLKYRGVGCNVGDVDQSVVVCNKYTFSKAEEEEVLDKFSMSSQEVMLNLRYPTQGFNSEYN